MINKAEIKMLRSLEKKKGRESNNLILVEGRRLIEQLIQMQVLFRKIWATEDFINKNINLVNSIKSATEIESISNQDLKKTTSTES